MRAYRPVGPHLSRDYPGEVFCRRRNRVWTESGMNFPPGTDVKHGYNPLKVSDILRPKRSCVSLFSFNPFVAFSPSFPSSFPLWFGYGVPDSKTASSALVVVSGGGGGGSGIVSVVSVFFALVCSCFLIFTRFCSVSLFRR